MCIWFSIGIFKPWYSTTVCWPQLVEVIRVFREIQTLYNGEFLFTVISGFRREVATTYLLACLLTYSTVQSPSWEANWFAASQEIPRISRNPKFHYRTYNVRHLSLSWASPFQSIYPHPTSWRSILILSTHLRLGLPSGLQSKHPACECFLTGLFYREGLLAPRPAPKLEYHPSSWSTTTHRLSATAYSIYSQLPSLSEAVPLFATWGRAMPWWQGPTTRCLISQKIADRFYLQNFMGVNWGWRYIGVGRIIQYFFLSRLHWYSVMFSYRLHSHSCSPI